jgi:hypothetical protein
MGRKVSGGLGIKVTVPQNTTIEQGKFYVLDGIFGMALQSVTTGAGVTSSVILSLESGEYETGQVLASDNFTKGTKIYYDTTNKRFTTTSSGNIFAGVVTVAEDAGNIIWFLFMPNSAEVASALGTAKNFATFRIPGTLAAGAGKVANFVFGKAVTIDKIKVRAGTLPGATHALDLDFNNGASSLFTAAQSIASTDTANEFVEFTPNADPAKNSFDDNDIFSIDVDNAGDTAAADVEIVVEFTQNV